MPQEGMDPAFAVVLCIRKTCFSVKPYEQSTLPWSTETKELDFLPFVTLYFVAVDVSQGAVLKNVLIPLVLVTVPHLSGEPCIGSN